jgi:Cu(I)/Ag(I) efflux system membrane fusion protein
MSRGLQRAALIAVGVLVIGVSIAVGYQWAKRGSHDDGAMAADPAAAGGNKVLYWYDPMVPNQHFDKPGKSPFMDMALQPKYADQGGADSTGIRVDASIQQNLGIRLAPVSRGTLDTAINAVGTVGFNERELAIVQARTNGFVSRVYARAPGDVVSRGAPLVDLLVPEWAGAQQEFIALRRSNDVPLVDAARDRLKLLGMPDAVMRHVEQTGQAQTTVTITAPIAGVILTLEARTGMTIATGMTLAQINALRTVWLTVAVPEAVGVGVAVGDTLSVQFAALAGDRVDGRVIAVLPQTEMASRTLAVRAELPNPEGRLRPGQYAQVQLRSAPAAAVLTIPSEAVIRSGARAVVIRVDHQRFQPVDVQTGRESGGRTEILSGLQEGEQIVASGQFLIDSEANLTGVLSQMSGGTNKPTRAASSPLYETVGTVEALDGNQITLSHQPVPALGWGAMTMPFTLAQPELAHSIKTADRVKFAFRQSGDQFVIERLEKIENAQNKSSMSDTNTTQKAGDSQ